MAKYRHFEVDRENGITVLSLLAPDLVDFLVTSELQDELVKFVEKEKPEKLIVSFHNVSRCSTEIINALLRARKRVVTSGGTLRLCAMPDQIRSVFKMLNLEGTVFHIYDTKAEATEAS